MRQMVAVQNCLLEYFLFLVVMHPNEMFLCLIIECTFEKGERRYHMSSVEELVQLAINYDEDAFVELMERHKGSMYKVAKSYLRSEDDVADAMSETVLDCFEHLGSLKEAKYFSTWLIRILINNCKDILKKNKGIDSLEEEMIPELIRNEDDQDFLDYLDPLPKDTRLIMILYYMWGFRTREIAELIHKKESTVKPKLLRGRDKIRQVFFPEIEQEGLG